MTSTRDEFDQLLSLYLPIGIGVAVLVFGLTAFALIRYRRGSGREPSGRSEWAALEIPYALLLVGVVAVLLTATFTTQADVDDTTDSPDLEVEVTAFQWGWRFTYPASGVSVLGNDNRPPTLAVPSEKLVQFHLRSRDVIHSFWIPEERFKRDAFPKRTTSFDLLFEREGMNRGVCAEFCGLRHARMLFNVLVLAPADFESWLEDRRGA